MYMCLSTRAQFQYGVRRLMGRKILLEEFMNLWSYHRAFCQLLKQAPIHCYFWKVLVSNILLNITSGNMFGWLWKWIIASHRHVISASNTTILMKARPDKGVRYILALTCLQSSQYSMAGNCFIYSHTSYPNIHLCGWCFLFFFLVGGGVRTDIYIYIHSYFICTWWWRSLTIR